MSEPVAAPSDNLKGGAAEQLPQPSAKLKADLLALVGREYSSTLRWTRFANLGMGVGGLVVLAGLFYALGGYAPGSRPPLFVWGTTGGWIAAALASSWIAVARGGRMGGRSSRVLLATTLLAPVLLMGWLLAWNQLYAPQQCDATISPWGLACHKLIVAMSAVMFISFAAMRRFGDAVHPKVAGAALGLAAACWSGLVMNLSCTCATPQHVLFGHVLPIAVTSVAGIGLGWWLLRIRAINPKA